MENNNKEENNKNENQKINIVCVNRFLTRIKCFDCSVFFVFGLVSGCCWFFASFSSYNFPVCVCFLSSFVSDFS